MSDTVITPLLFDPKGLAPVTVPSKVAPAADPPVAGLVSV
jgi:hypothetical protein